MSDFTFRQQGFRVLAQSSVGVSFTGATTEHIFATIAIPANTLGKNGRLRITSMWSFTSSANNKTIQERFGASGSGTGGTSMLSVVATTSGGEHFYHQIGNRNAANSQVGTTGNSTGLGGGAAAVTTAIDTTAATEINLTGTLALGSETLTLESYTVEVLFAP